MSSLSRRNLLRGRWHNPTSAIRPPWIVSESVFIDKCNRCHACVESCETNVIVCGAGNYPELDFNRAECSFCGACAEACKEAVFDKGMETPWRHKIEIDSACLAFKGVECRICQDNCEFSAITFKLSAGRVAQPVTNLALCNGCGACIGHCPAKAISVTDKALNGER